MKVAGVISYRNPLFSARRPRFTVHARMKFTQECQFARVSLSARIIALNYFELHVRNKICVSEIQSFLLLKPCQMSNLG